MKEIQDYYFKLAKEKGYLARSIYKLKEMDEKYTLIHKGNTILDLGAAPGSWTQYILEVLKCTGKVVAVDLKNITLHPKHNPFLKAIQGSFKNSDVIAQIEKYGPYDLIVSDAAPSTSGDRFVDACNSAELASEVINLAEKNLKKGRNLVIKIFQGGDELAINAKMKTLFNRVKVCKPKASKDESIEVYYIGFELI